MAQERSAPTPPAAANAAEWDVLTAELRAYRNQQKQTWGDLDNALIGRFLAGEVTPHERRTVEAALKDHPELRKLTDLVLDVLNEFESAPSATPAPLPEQPRPPRLLSFTEHAKNRRPFLSRLRERGALVAAACLLLALGVTLLRLPESGPTTTASRKDEAKVTEVFKPARGSDLASEEDHFPVATVAPTALPSPGAAPAVPLERIKAVTSWTERRLNVRRHMGAGVDSKPTLLSFGVGGAKSKVVGTAPAGGHAKKDADRKSELGRAVPYLVQGVLQEKELALQDRCGRALSRMAPVARDAVPALTKQLGRSRCLEQQQVVVEVLKNFGPAAREAAPVLAELAANGAATLKPRAEEALRYICPPRWLGVQDSANVLTAQTCQFVNQQARVLAQKHHFAFVAETVSRLPADARWDKAKLRQVLTDLALKRCRDANAERGVYVLICPESQTVEVTLNRNLQGKDARLTTEAVRNVIQNGLRQNNLKQGLEDAVRLVDKELSAR